MHRIPCPQCGHRLKYLEAHVGKRARCQKCGLSFVLPPPGGAPQLAEVEIEGEAADELVQMLDPIEPVEQIPPVPRWQRLDLPVFAGYLYLLFGVPNVIAALVILINGPAGCGRGPIVKIGDDTTRALTFFATSAAFLLGNALFVALGYLQQTKQKVVVWAGIGLAVVLIFIHGAYWWSLNMIPIDIVETAILGAFVWLGVTGVRGMEREEAL